MENNRTVETKVTLVTGAAMGIGLACAEAFAKEGYITIFSDINEPKEQVQKMLDAGYKAAAYKCDVSDVQQVKEMVDWIVATYGRLDASLNDAGIQTPQRPMAEITDDEFDRTVAVDFKGVWNSMRYEILQMLKQGGGYSRRSLGQTRRDSQCRVVAVQSASELCGRTRPIGGRRFYHSLN